MIFSRSGRRTGRHARVDPPRERGRAREPQRSLAEELGVGGEAGAGPAGPEPGGAAEQPAAEATAPAASAGPYDVTEAPPGVARLDLGSLQIPSVTGVQVRVQANQEGTVSRVVLVHGASALQLAAFAAPRSEPIWDEVREDIRKSLFAEGVAVEETEGEYGGELRARVRTPEGLKDLRFVGVDGPRWLVRADFQGPAAVDPARTPELLECLRGLVVDRGDEARPAKEALPLRLSAKMAAQVQQQAAAAQRSTTPLGAAGISTPTTTGGAALPGSNGPAPVPRRRKPSPRPRHDDAGRGPAAGAGQG